MTLEVLTACGCVLWMIHILIRAWIETRRVVKSIDVKLIYCGNCGKAAGSNDKCSRCQPKYKKQTEV
jgi:hypothetical protein